MNHEVASCLSVSFLQSNGIEVPKTLRDWLTRASYLAKNRGSAKEQRRYVYWALRTIEEAAAGEGGVSSVNWKTFSPVMAPGTPEEPVPRMLAAANSSVPSAPANAAATEDRAREAVLSETLKRASTQLAPFVTQAFQLYDSEVAAGKRRYLQVSSLEMINLAKNLFTRDHKQRSAAATFSASALLSTVVPASSTQGRYQTAAPVSTRHQADSRTDFPTLADRSSAADAKRDEATPVTRRHHEPERRKRGRAHDEDASHEPALSPLLTARPLGTSIEFFCQLAVGQRGESTFGGSSSPTMQFIGTSSEMERSYSRYEPTAEDIRPLPVLHEAFEFVRCRGEEKRALEGDAAALKYLNEQLKGMRQDLRVQNINDNFAVSVYEFHARLCLELGDIGEFNQCQSALKRLYTHPGVVEKEVCCVSEFFVYRLVYLSLSQQYDALSTELINYTNDMLTDNVVRRSAARLVDKDAVHRALNLAAACGDGDCPSLLQELQHFPVQMSCLVRIYLQRLRVGWLQEILFGVRGALSLRFLMANLGFTPVRGCIEGDQRRCDHEGLFWIDGSSGSAAREFASLFEVLKVPLPSGFRFGSEVNRDARRDHAGGSRNTAEAVPSLDAAATRAIVEQYVAYLRTRKDAKGTS